VYGPGVGRRPDKRGAEERRKSFACPSAHGRYEGIELDHLDPADPDDRRILIEAAHPELHRALRRGDDEIVLHGTTMSPRMHIALHEIVANQLWVDDPPETWQTAQRLSALGYERDEVVHMLCSVVARELWHVVGADSPSDPERFAAKLDELPESWFALAKEP
jgi:Domain of unknown function (DUF1841)